MEEGLYHEGRENLYIVRGVSTFTNEIDKNDRWLGLVSGILFPIRMVNFFFTISQYFLLFCYLGVEVVDSVSPTVNKTTGEHWIYLRRNNRLCMRGLTQILYSGYIFVSELLFRITTWSGIESGTSCVEVRTLIH